MAAVDLRPANSIIDDSNTTGTVIKTSVVATTSNSDEYIEKCARSNEKASRYEELSRLFVFEKLPPMTNEELYVNRIGLRCPTSAALRNRLANSSQEAIEAILYKSSIDRGRAKAFRGAFVAEAGDFSGLAIWEPNFAPTASDCEGPVPVPFPDRPVFSEFLTGIEELKRKYLYPVLWEAQQDQLSYKVLDEWTAKALEKRSEDKQLMYWYLGLMSRNPSVPPVKGAVRAVVEPFIQKWVDQAGMPAVWLEAGSPHARDVYSYFGFRSVGEVIVGQDSEGKGISTWCMIYTKGAK